MPMAKNICKLPLEFCQFSSPVGTIKVSSCSVGLHEMGLDSSLSDENFAPNGLTDVLVMGAKGKDLSTIMKLCHEWLQQYFRDPKLISQILRPDICALKQEKKGFRAQVWQILADTVGPGEVITYGALASKLNNPGAVRAVGSAMRNNPTGIIVPCHRVVRSNDMGLYHGGKRQSVKLWLLKHEGVDKY
ncbi:methylated-DNA--protein-cysteine methyltransferase-like isoform X1 [Macrobrachium nipponense]|uniref:methylated-DNA--protein-cysteine methyltransferase-like isoform X1 n=1 Tax=Macrobrachium nipponense TaxID=159736 RepID=UPI0030C88141